MSVEMTLGVLRMPFSQAMADELSRAQYHARGLYAAAEIERLNDEAKSTEEELQRVLAENAKLREIVEKLRKTEDGVPIVEQNVYAAIRGAVRVVQVSTEFRAVYGDEVSDAVLANTVKFYSTRDLASAAIAGQGEPPVKYPKCLTPLGKCGDGEWSPK